MPASGSARKIPYQNVQKVPAAWPAHVEPQPTRRPLSECRSERAGQRHAVGDVETGVARGQQVERLAAAIALQLFADDDGAIQHVARIELPEQPAIDCRM